MSEHALSITGDHPGFHDQPATRVLMLTHRAPWPPNRGDRIRSWNLLKELGRNFDVSLACVSDEPLARGTINQLQKHCRRLAVARIDPGVMRLRAAAALVGGRAMTPTMFFRRDLAARIMRWHVEQPFDAVLTFCTGMIDYARLLTNVRYIPRRYGYGPIRHVMDLVDVDSAKWLRYAGGSKPPLSWVYAAEAKRLRCIEAGDRDWFDALTVVSDAEAATYRAQVGEHSRLRVVGNGVDTKFFAPLSDKRKPRIAFVGALDYKPNVEGICWFADHVLPQIAQRVPAAQLMIVGRRPNARIRALDKRHNITVHPDVPDVRTYLAKASIVVAPLWIAPGVQNKVLEAMACRRAVVASPAAAAGIAAIPGDQLLVGEGTNHFAALCCRMLTDAGYRKRVAASARRLVEQRYTWERALAPMVDLLAGRAVTPMARPQSPIAMPPPAAAA